VGRPPRRVGAGAAVSRPRRPPTSTSAGKGGTSNFGREAVQELTMLGRQERRGLLGVRRTRGTPASANRSLV
jgi:hypothetical protein